MAGDPQPLRAYGDRRDDGVIQLSFTLPVPLSDKAKEAARQFCAKLGLVDVKVADRLDRNVDARMPGQQVQHVVEKADSGRDPGYTGPVEIYRDLDIGLFGLALDGCRAHGKAISRVENAGLLTGRYRLRYCGMALR